MSTFLAFFAIFLELVCRTESVRQRNRYLVTERVFFYLFCGQAIDSFVALTQCNKQIPIKCQKNAKKEDMVKIGDHCIRKIKLGFIVCENYSCAIYDEANISDD